MVARHKGQGDVFLEERRRRAAGYHADLRAALVEDSITIAGNAALNHFEAHQLALRATGSDDLLQPPPMLDNDSVLVVQQDAKTLQARLENGEQLAVRLDGSHQQTLNGSAVARRQAGGGDLQFSLQFDDGNRIDETWSRAADGRTLQVTERWQPGFLQRPVVFHRVYRRVD